MHIENKKCTENTKCNECGRKLQESIHDTYSIACKHSKNKLLLCDDCFMALKKEISEMWIAY